MIPYQAKGMAENNTKDAVRQNPKAKKTLKSLIYKDLLWFFTVKSIAGLNQEKK